MAAKGRPKGTADNRVYYCAKCGQRYTKQTGNFYKGQSSLYEGNNGYLPVCRKCMEELFDTYAEKLGSEEEAMKRVCQKFDMYYSPAIFNMTEKTTNGYTRLSAYCSKLSLRGYSDKTYDNTIEEESSFVVVSDDKDPEEMSDDEIPEDAVRLFGTGYTPEAIRYLYSEYRDWVTRNECNTKAQEELFKNIAIAQLNIREAQAGRGRMKLSEANKTFLDLLGSAGIKPIQSTEGITSGDQTVGTLINEWEKHDPIMEPKDEWKDVDKIKYYITVYFYGHLCKMMGKKNFKSRLYEKEMDKYRVEKPEYSGDDDMLLDAVLEENCEDD